MSFVAVLISIGVIFLLSFFTESLVEYVFGPLFDRIKAITPYKWVMMYLSGAVGILVAFYYQFDLPYLLGNFLAAQFDFSPDQLPKTLQSVSTIGMLMTGIAISRGANYLHDIVSKYFKKPQMPEAVG